MIHILFIVGFMGFVAFEAYGEALCTLEYKKWSVLCLGVVLLVLVWVQKPFLINFYFDLFIRGLNCCIMLYWYFDNTSKIRKKLTTQKEHDKELDNNK